jgi:VIT1/CCC1 family predicted Fe2+/Mn2+ transporter
MAHREFHKTENVNWLRAAVLGANDGLISTSSLILGVASAQPDPSAILLAGVAGMVAGSLSMAAGEYVSVSSQADSEAANLAKERKELETEPAKELAELTGIYVQRGLTADLAAQVAQQLTAHDVFAAHARDELGIVESTRARPVQAALASAAAFATGAALPVVLAIAMPANQMSMAIVGATLVFLLVLGSLAAHLGGASPVRGAIRVAFWGAVAMGITAAVGRWSGTSV